MPLSQEQESIIAQAKAEGILIIRINTNVEIIDPHVEELLIAASQQIKTLTSLSLH